MLYEHMFVLCSAVRNVYTAVGNVHSAMGNVHSALRNIKQKPFPDTITNSFRDFYRRLSLYLYIKQGDTVIASRVRSRTVFFLFSSITSITNSVNYHIYRRLYSDRRCDRRVIVVIEERFFNVKIGDFSHKFTIKRGHSEGLYPIIINNIE